MTAGLPGNVNGGTFVLRDDEYVEMDQEWVELMVEAKLIGLTLEQVRMILNGDRTLCKS